MNVCHDGCFGLDASVDPLVLCDWQRLVLLVSTGGSLRFSFIPWNPSKSLPKGLVLWRKEIFLQVVAEFAFSSAARVCLFRLCIYLCHVVVYLSFCSILSAMVSFS